MNKKTRKHFEKLWRVQLLKQLKEMEGSDSRITMSVEEDYFRSLKFIEYGFLEGIKLYKGEK